MLIRPFVGPRAPRCDASVIMHELGHTLTLDHGGGDSNNCKPNYVSIMNYDHICGLEGSLQVDFSPPRHLLGRTYSALPGLGFLPALDEAALEPITLDVNDGINETLWTNSEGTKISQRLSSAIFWDDLTELNIDVAHTNGRPSVCKANTDLEVLEGHNDWRNISLSLLEFGQSASGPVDLLDPQDEITSEEAVEIAEGLNSADLVLSKSADTDPVEAGNELVYTLRVENVASRPARAVALVDHLPDEVSLVETGTPCDLSDGELRCEIGEVRPAQVASIEIRVATDGVCASGTPVAEIENRAEAQNVFDLAGPDLEPADNSASTTTAVIDTTPPSISCNTPLTMTPAEAPITLTPTSADVCDAGAATVVTEFDCYMFNRKGTRVSKLDSCVVELQRDSLTIVDTGGVGDVIEFEVSAGDASGNTASATCRIEIVNPTGR